MLYESINIPLWHALRRYGGKRILDVGCGTGALGELLKANDNTVTGITYSKEEAEIARLRIDDVKILDLNRFDPQQSGIVGKFDLLIFGDVLEHLLCPRETLKCLVAHFLESGGTVFVSLPNVACFYVRFGLLFGRFEMSEKGGILDATHLHFYTRKSARALLMQAGLQIERTRYVPACSVWLYGLIKSESRAGATPDKMKDRGSFVFYERYLYPLEALFTACWPGMLANQFVFQCSRV